MWIHSPWDLAPQGIPTCRLCGWLAHRPTLPLHHGQQLQQRPRLGQGHCQRGACAQCPHHAHAGADHVHTAHHAGTPPPPYPCVAPAQRQQRWTPAPSAAPDCPQGPPERWEFVGPQWPPRHPGAPLDPHRHRRRRRPERWGRQGDGAGGSLGAGVPQSRTRRRRDHAGARRVPCRDAGCEIVRGPHGVDPRLRAGARRYGAWRATPYAPVAAPHCSPCCRTGACRGGHVPVRGVAGIDPDGRGHHGTRRWSCPCP